MRILVSNDDGVYSPGIVALARAAGRFGEVRIVAPDVENSAKAHAITSTRPLRIRRCGIDGFDAWHVDGTPADCVALGIHLWESVDLVLSGINLGLNIGNSIWHSGTVAAARQAVLHGVRGIAVSTSTTDGRPDFDALTESVDRVLETVVNDDRYQLLNVNVPPDSRGIRWCRQSVRHYDGRVHPSEAPWGEPVYWFNVKPLEATDPDTDRAAVGSGYTSVTPLHVDLTDEATLELEQRAHQEDATRQ